MKPITQKFEEANQSLANACIACKSSCCKKGLLFLLPEEKEQIEKWILTNNPDWHERFLANLKEEQDFFLFDQEDSCMFLDTQNLCRLHEDGVKPQECFVWPLHVYEGDMGNPQIRVSTTCCEGYKFVEADTPSVHACESYAHQIGHDRLSRFREIYKGSYGNRFVKEIELQPKVRSLKSDELHLYRAAGEAFFPGEDWDKGMQRISGMHARHTDGLLVYEDDGKIIGYATLWPLSSEAVAKLKTSELTDSHIDEQAMPQDRNAHVSSWIMTAIAVNEPDRTRRRQIVTGLLYAIFLRMNLDSESEIYAHAATDKGHAFLTRSGFKFNFLKAPSLCVLNIKKN